MANYKEPNKFYKKVEVTEELRNSWSVTKPLDDDYVAFKSSPKKTASAKIVLSSFQ